MTRRAGTRRTRHGTGTRRARRSSNDTTRGKRTRSGNGVRRLQLPEHPAEAPPPPWLLEVQLQRSFQEGRKGLPARPG